MLIWSSFPELVFQTYIHSPLYVWQTLPMWGTRCRFEEEERDPGKQSLKEDEVGHVWKEALGSGDRLALNREKNLSPKS